MENKKIVICTGFRFGQISYPAGKKAVDVPGSAARFALESGFAMEPTQNKAIRPGSNKKR